VAIRRGAILALAMKECSMREQMLARLAVLKQEFEAGETESGTQVDVRLATERRLRGWRTIDRVGAVCG
jgi:hypothetical protein